MTPAGLEQYRLDRLLELRAVIDSLRAERGRELLRRCLGRTEPPPLLGRAESAAGPTGRLPVIPAD